MSKLLEDAQITGIKAQGEAQIKAIQSTVGDSRTKAVAIAKVVVNTQLAIVKASRCKI